jgi:hypothetical protein
MFRMEVDRNPVVACFGLADQAPVFWLKQHFHRQKLSFVRFAEPGVYRRAQPEKAVFFRLPFHEVEVLFQLHQSSNETPNERLDAGLPGIDIRIGYDYKNGVGVAGCHSRYLALEKRGV